MKKSDTGQKEGKEDEDGVEKVLSNLKDLADKKPVSVGGSVEMKRSVMRGIFYLCALHIAGVTSLKLMPFKVWEFSGPYYGWPQSRVYGGTVAREEEYSFMILFLYFLPDGRGNTCSGCLLASDWVLTAAHCINRLDVPPEDYILVGGKASLEDYMYERLDMGPSGNVNETHLGVEERRARALYVHPNFTLTEDKILHDIALIKVDKAFTKTQVATIPLSFEKIVCKKTCTILGWGLTPFGKKYELNVVREKEISTTSIGCRCKTNHPLICLTSDKLSGLCQGDSGSPLVCDGKVWGVASYMLTEVENPNNCTDTIEEYYVELSAEESWIRSVLNAGSGPIEANFVRGFTFAVAAQWMFRHVLK